jgi:hypothetical protein
LRAVRLDFLPSAYGLLTTATVLTVDLLFASVPGGPAYGP